MHHASALRLHDDVSPLPQRLFLAVPLSDDARRALSARLPRHLPGKRVPSANWHVTLRFLGETPHTGRDRLLDALVEEELPPPFEVRFAELGAFPRPERARNVWVGLDEGVVELAELARGVERAVLRAGLPPTDQRFAPHLTITRLREPASVASELRGTEFVGVRMPVDEIVLYQSELMQGGARYTALTSIPLVSA